MQKTFPLIRAASMFPIISWLVAHHRPIEEYLHRAGLPHVWLDDPIQPVPMRAVADLVSIINTSEGPDLFMRVVEPGSVLELGGLGRAAAGSRTLRDALTRVSLLQPYHSTHAYYSIAPVPGGVALQHGWTIPLDPAALSAISGFVASLIQTLVTTLPEQEPVFRRVEIRAESQAALDQLRPYIRGDLVQATRPALSLTFSDAVLDTPLPRALSASARTMVPPDWRPLRDLRFDEAARLVVRSMLKAGAPSAERLAYWSDMSLRSFQRRLGETGLSFSGIVESERRLLAEQALAGSRGTIGELAAHLGYARQSSLTRAVRRWTGSAPQDLRASLRRLGDE